MNQRELRGMEASVGASPDRPSIQAEIAALEHVELAVDRHTTLPTSELRKEIDVLKIEERLAANLDDALRLLKGAFRAADLLRIDVLGDLHEAERRVIAVQSELARQRGSE